MNLEAMACATAVVATAVGGIPEVVVAGETGLLSLPGTDGGADGPAGVERFARDFATRVNTLLDDPNLARCMGENGRRRGLSRFSWAVVAEQVLKAYVGLGG
ncbi:glycosyltransferase [Micromonospora zamorensis]|uniref:glycosyltransferase n=1 Tax=Micromonospora zamorensis TaxID=709883 RepID=UPI003D9987CA